ncbi:MAG: replication initiation factor domain-containing protein [Chloroflexi bacterium]|nr:replication initiation factor domain-containing protein [Chloroflexota bacterium]
MIYDLFFKDSFGELQSMGHGGRGFQEIWFSLLGFKVYASPSQGDLEYFHFEIPGQACEVISWEILQGLDDVLRSNYGEHYHYSRLDFAFDELPFTPQDVEQAIRDGKVRSLAKRKTMAVKQSPFEIKENGEIGTYTVYFGSRQSERMIRVYDRRGFTRLELELKAKRADLIAKQIFRESEVSEAFEIVMSHLRDYVNFDAPWWTEFVSGIGRAWAIVSTPREIKEASIITWLTQQVGPSLSVIHDLNPDFTKTLIASGRVKRKKAKKYKLLLDAKRQDQENQKGKQE